MARILSFQYIVSGGDKSLDLDYKSTSALNLNGSDIYTTSSSENAILDLPSPSATNSLSDGSDIVIGTFSVSASTFQLQSIQTSGVGLAKTNGNGSIVIPSIQTSGIGDKKNTGSGSLTLSQIESNGLGGNLNSYPTIVLSPRNIESLTTYNNEEVLVTANGSFDYAITSADGLSANLVSRFENYNQTSTSSYSVDVYVATPGTLVVTATGFDIFNSVFRESTDSVTVNVNKYETPNRYETSAYSEINLKNLLPVHLEYSETGEFLEFFEDFLNEMYYEFVSHRENNDLFDVDSDGVKTYYRISADSDGEAITSAAEINVSGTSLYSSAYDVKYNVNKTTKLSLLEKAKRLTDLHDPSLIDIEYIQDIANYMGYDISIHRDNIDEIGNFSDEYSTNRYLRNVVSNLPQWYNIKSTDNAIKALLYSFGVVGEIIQKWTKGDLSNAQNHPTSGGYGNDLSLWSGYNSTSGSINLSAIPDDYFPTPHFDILIDVVSTPPSWFQNIDKISKSIDSIRPIQSVFDRIIVVFQDTIETLYVRNDQYTEQKIVFGLNTDYPPIPSSAVDVFIETGSAETVFIETGSASIVYIEDGV